MNLTSTLKKTSTPHNQLVQEKQRKSKLFHERAIQNYWRE